MRKGEPRGGSGESRRRMAEERGIEK